jgi:Tol biopolymer transport system component
MKHSQNDSRRFMALILALAGFLSWNLLPIGSSVQTARAAARRSVTGLSAQSAAGAVANGKIAFVSNASGTYQVYTMNPDGTDRTQLTFEKKGAWHPGWSPDGARIAYVRGTGGRNNEVLVMNADGSNQTRLAEAGFADSPTWSPDGTRIAFDAVSDDRVLRNVLCVVNADGTDQRVMADLSVYAFPAWSLAWSPNGSKLAASGFFGPIVLMNLDGSHQTHITEPPSGGPYDIHPAWSPDGSRIAFTRVTDCDFNDCYAPHVWLINVDGSNERMLTGEDMSGDNPAWSPDGQKIIFSSYGELWTTSPDGSSLSNITNSNESEWAPSWQPVVAVVPPNEINDAQFFVRQHYRDFLNREPDAEGLAFWTNEITSCGGDAQCIEAKRINVSAAYFLSIEFQQTGYLVYRTYKTAYGNLPDAPVPIRLNEFLPDTQEIGQGVVVNQSGWETVLENNKQAFTAEFVQRPRFTAAFPLTMTAEEFVDKTNNNAGNSLSQTERDHLVSDLGAGTKTRAEILRAVAEAPNLVNAEFNRAFVLMQYFGYLRRDPNAGPNTDFEGYNFWLTKLNQFNGDYVEAEMVKSFLVSNEYRQRFNP